MIPEIILKKEREISLLRKHPWVFSNSIAKIRGNPQSGETVAVKSCEGSFLGRGAYSPKSQISVRMWTFDSSEQVIEDLFAQRIRSAVDQRKKMFGLSQQAACRLIYAESDYLPGVIADLYDNFIVCQFTSAGADFWKPAVVRALKHEMPVDGIFERSDIDVRTKEGLELTKGVLYGKEPPALVEIRENGFRVYIDIQNGHKTGFYLDQRDNRALVKDYAKNADVLNCFSYTGAFALAALQGGAASVTNIDSSRSALDLCIKNCALNGLAPDKTVAIEGDVFQVLRTFRDSRRTFDIIILDPPKFAESKSQIPGAVRGYKDINLLALKLIRPGGLLVTFSCSGLIDAELFQKIVYTAVMDAERDAQIVKRLFQASDHPTALHFPEGSYLKGLLCCVK